MAIGCQSVDTHHCPSVKPARGVGVQADDVLAGVVGRKGEASLGCGSRGQKMASSAEPRRQESDECRREGQRVTVA